MNLKIFSCTLLLGIWTSLCLQAQSTEVQQLLLNVEKLSQLKNILSDMQKGYQIVSTGYNAVKGISQGNFSLHQFFLDGLMMVSPEVKKYRHVADIISNQKNIVSEYSSAFNRFRGSQNFSSGELGYLGQVYRQILNQSLDNLDQLLTVITASKLRMNDAERLGAIDRIFKDSEDKLQFLRSFNTQAAVLDAQRTHEHLDIQSRLKLYSSGL